MNLRILKKLAKRAAPYLIPLGDNREQFKAEKDGNYIGIGTRRFDRKHWERMRSVHNEVIGDGYKYPAKNGKGYISVSPPNHPLKGTPMVGSMTGHEQPEWDEEDAYSALIHFVAGYFTDWHNWDEDDGAYPKLVRDISTPSLLFKAADDALFLIAQEKAGAR